MGESSKGATRRARYVTHLYIVSYRTTGVNEVGLLGLNIGQV